MATVLALGVGLVPPGAIAQSRGAADERGLVGATWAGGDAEELEGFDHYGGSYVRGGLAVAVLRSEANQRDWILISKIEIGRHGRNARWRGLDTLRLTAPDAASYVAYCRRSDAGPDHVDLGLLALVGGGPGEGDEPGLMRADWAIEIDGEGRFVAISEAVVCPVEGDEH
ncbi:hypothetical protein [Brevundimonas sp.]|uniref:hypothetical protein n=1 Tax=Brevundimonas sp. TaxID=1871086 RepID=UPI002D666D2C|nr:hypothetical protein [Brevundimonas sp.]HYD27499.1 hypothetical protein [Brevundimonas sp.]